MRGFMNGDEGDRTPNPWLAKPVLSQLSYVPKKIQGPTAFAAGQKKTGSTQFKLLSHRSFGSGWIRTSDLVVISDAL